VPLAPEVDAFQAEVGRDQHFMASGNPQYGTIVTDSAARTRAALRRRAANALDQNLFLQRQGSLPAWIERQY
jgi:hypothetical protein